MAAQSPSIHKKQTTQSSSLLYSRGIGFSPSTSQLSVDHSSLGAPHHPKLAASSNESLDSSINPTFTPTLTPTASYYAHLSSEDARLGMSDVASDASEDVLRRTQSELAPNTRSSVRRRADSIKSPTMSEREQLGYVELPSLGTTLTMDREYEEGLQIFMSELLQDSEGVALFKEDLKTDGEDSLLTFWLQASEHKKNKQPDSLTSSALKICSAFILEKATMPVRLSPACATELQDHLQHADRYFFLRALKEVHWRLIHRFAKFVETDAFGNWVEDKQHRESVPLVVNPDDLLKPSKSKFKSLMRSLTKRNKQPSLQKYMSRRYDSKRLKGGPSSSSSSASTTPRSAARLRSTLLGLAIETMTDLSPPTFLLNVHIYDLLERDHMAAVPDLLNSAVFHYYRLRENKKTSEDPPYVNARREWGEGRGVAWYPGLAPSSRGSSLTADLKETHKIAAKDRALCVQWITPSSFRVIFSSGTIITYSTKQNNGDLEKINIDVSLSSKLSDKGNLHIVDAKFLDRGLLISLFEKPSVGLILTKLGEGGKVLQGESSLVLSDVRMGQFQAYRAAGYLSVNTTQSLAVLWWARPCPELSVVDNMVLCYIDYESSRVHARCTLQPDCYIYSLFFHPSEADLFYAVYNDTYDPADQVLQFATFRAHTSEEKEHESASSRALRYLSLKRKSHLGAKHKIEALDSAPVPLQSPLAAVAMNYSGTKSVFVCCGGEIMLTGSTFQSPLRRETSLLDPVAVQWNPSDSMFAVCTKQGAVQVFDTTLSPVWLALATEEAPALNFVDVRVFGLDIKGVEGMSWSVPRVDGSGSGGDRLALALAGGPIVVLHVLHGVTSSSCTTPHLVLSRLKMHKVESAIEILRQMDWTQTPQDAHLALIFVLNYLFKLPYSPSVHQLIKLCFPPFAWQISETSIMANQYHAKVRALQWRYFSWLLAQSRFLDALQVCTASKSHEMCEALYHAAKDREGEDMRLISIMARSACDVIAASLPSENVSFV